MNRILLVFLTIFFSLSTNANGILFSEKILAEAEFARLEETLYQQVDHIKGLRAEMKAGQEDLDKTRKLITSILVYSLEQLQKEGKTIQLKRLSQILDREELRKRLYYPVNVKKTFSGNERYYVSWEHNACVAPLELYQIKTGAVIMIEGGGRFDFNGTTLRIVDIFTTADGQTKRYNLVKYDVDDEHPMSSTLKATNTGSTRLTKSYNCELVNEYYNLLSENKKLIDRYEELGRYLRVKSKDFYEELEGKTISEALGELTSTLPENENAPSTPKEANP